MLILVDDLTTNITLRHATIVVMLVITALIQAIITALLVLISIILTGLPVFLAIVLAQPALVQIPTLVILA